MKPSSCALSIVIACAAMACSSAPARETPTSAVEPAQPTPPAEETDAGAPPAPKASDPHCVPKDVSAYQPNWKPPAPRQHVCTDEQLVAITPCASGQSGAAGCTRFLADGTADDLACANCVKTRDSDPTWGATVKLADKRIFLNSAGCIALVDPTREPCAKAEQAANECTNLACYSTCFANPRVSEADKLACGEGAALGGCKPYVDRAVLCRVSIDESHSPAAACFVAFDDPGFRTVAALFCGK